MIDPDAGVVAANAADDDPPKEKLGDCSGRPLLITDFSSSAALGFEWGESGLVCFMTFRCLCLLRCSVFGRSAATRPSTQIGSVALALGPLACAEVHQQRGKPALGSGHADHGRVAGGFHSEQPEYTSVQQSSSLTS